MQTEPEAQVVAPAVKGNQEHRSVYVLNSATPFPLTPTNTAALSPDGRLSRDDCGKDSKKSVERRELGHCAVVRLVEGNRCPGAPPQSLGRYIAHARLRNQRWLAASIMGHVEDLEYPANTRAEDAERRRCRSVVTTDGVGGWSWGPVFTRSGSIANENKRRGATT